MVGGQSPVNDKRVGGKHNIVKQADSGLGGWMLRNFQGESLKPNTSLRFVRLPSACHGWDSSRWLPTHTLTFQSEKAMAPHSSTLAWKIPWMEEAGRLQSMESLRVGHN